MPHIVHDEITSGVLKGSLRESVVDAIVTITPTDTPFLSHRPRTKCIQIIHVSPYDTLAAATNTGTTEGTSFSDATLIAPTRVENYTQIWRVDWGVSGTQEAVGHYGMDDPYRYYLKKALKLVANNMECALTKAAGTVGATNVTRTCKGLVSATNVLNTTFATATASTMTEAHFNTMCQAAWDNGAAIDEVYSGPYMKRATILTWTVNTRNVEADTLTLYGNVDVYVGPFGRLRWYLSRRMTENSSTHQTNDIAVIQGDLFRFAKLREENIPLHRTGDQLQGTVIVEGTLECANPYGGVYATNASHAAF